MYVGSVTTCDKSVVLIYDIEGNWICL